MQKGEPLESIVAVKIMTAKVKTDDKDVAKLISEKRRKEQRRKDQGRNSEEIQELVSKTINILIHDNKYDEDVIKIINNHWLLSNIINSDKPKLVDDDWKIIDGHSLANTSEQFFDEYSNELNEGIINMLGNKRLSYPKIGKLCLLLEIVNPDFNYFKENMGIKVQLPRVKKVLRIFQKNYFKIVDGENFSEEEFIQTLIRLEVKEFIQMLIEQGEEEFIPMLIELGAKEFIQMLIELGEEEFIQVLIELKEKGE